MPSPGIELGSSRLPVSAILDFRFGLVLARFDLGPRNKVPKVNPVARDKVWKRRETRKKKKIMEPTRLELGSSRMPVSAILDVRFGLVLGVFDLGPRNKIPKVSS